MIDEKLLLEKMQTKKDEIKEERPFGDEFSRGFAFAMEFVKHEPMVGVSDEWVRIFKNYIASYDAVNLLQSNDLFDEEETLIHKANILRGIIETFRSEVEE